LICRSCSNDASACPRRWSGHFRSLPTAFSGKPEHEWPSGLSIPVPEKEKRRPCGPTSSPSPYSGGRTRTCDLRVMRGICCEIAKSRNQYNLRQNQVVAWFNRIDTCATCCTCSTPIWASFWSPLTYGSSQMNPRMSQPRKGIAPFRNRSDSRRCSHAAWDNPQANRQDGQDPRAAKQFSDRQGVSQNFSRHRVFSRLIGAIPSLGGRGGYERRMSFEATLDVIGSE